MLDKFKDECGVFGIYGHPEAANLAYLGLYALQHRGQESAGIAAADGVRVRVAKGMGHVNDVFDTFDGVTFSGPRGDVTYQAFYVEGGFFLTPGDYRRYDKKTGTWARTVPQQNAFFGRCTDGCGWGLGAIQLVARYTYLDLISGNPVLTPTSGGARAGFRTEEQLAEPGLLVHGLLRTGAKGPPSACLAGRPGGG